MFLDFLAIPLGLRPPLVPPGMFEDALLPKSLQCRLFLTAGGSAWQVSSCWGNSKGKRRLEHDVWSCPSPLSHYCLIGISRMLVEQSTNMYEIIVVVFYNVISLISALRTWKFWIPCTNSLTKHGNRGIPLNYLLNIYYISMIINGVNGKKHGKHVL